MAGAMDSRNGRATAAPIPRRNIRRGSDFLAMTILEISSQLARLQGSHLKRNAFHNAQNDLVEAVPFAFASRTIARTTGIS
jgi:hypothetical protein